MPKTLDPECVETRTLLDAAPFRGASVLEIGCGRGRSIFRYADQTRRTVGVDRSAEALSAAEEALPERLGSQVSFLRADARDLPLRSNSFDIALLAWSL